MKPSDELPPPKKKRADGQVTGLAGELFVAAELLKRGLQTSVTFGNAKAIDLLAYNPDTKKTYTVQVKTVRTRNAFPITHERVEENHTYVASFSAQASNTSDQPTDGHWNSACERENQDMLGINNCAFLRFKKADATLNRLYKEKNSAIHTSKNAERFRAAQRTWISFRDKICLYEAGLTEETGSIWPYNYYGCMEFYTQRRIQDMQVYLRCKTDDCPN